MKLICDCGKEMKNLGDWPRLANLSTDEVVAIFRCCGHTRVERPGLRAVRDPDDAQSDIRWHIETRTGT